MRTNTLATPARLGAQLACAILLAGCGGRFLGLGAPPPRALPALPVETVAEPAPRAAGQPRALEREQRVTLTATGADVRELLPALASAAGVDLVLGPEVRGTVSVHFDDVPAREALHAVLGAAGLTIDTGPPSPPWSSPVIFYQIPMHVDRVNAAVMAARFGVSTELARWMVEQRPR